MTEYSENIKVEPKEAPKKLSSSFDRKVESEKAKFQLEQNAVARDERLRRSMLVMATAFFWFFAAILAISIFIFAWHKLAPNHLEFLGAHEIDSIQTFLIGSTLMVVFMLLINNISTYLYNKNH